MLTPNENFAKQTPLIKAIDILMKGGIGVMPTDTIYGIVGLALSKKAVERIYKVRHRQLKKPMIILIGTENDLKFFDIKIGGKTKKILNRFWPGKTSVILPCFNEKFVYLHRGTKSLAFRLPRLLWLRRFLIKTGPLVAPSANPEGLSPAETIAEAKKYFGKKIDFYLNAGRMTGKPSKLIKISNGKINILRK